MDNYQKELIEIFKNYRPDPKYPIYPPYHEGLYLEDYFFDYFLQNDTSLNRYYIPVFWTTIYVDNCFHGLQDVINKLDPDKKYFTFAQHDDAVREKLPPNTISFNAGGNGGGIPIPLICSLIPDKYKQEVPRDIFCSFVGSATHPIRGHLYNLLKNDSKYKFSARKWTDQVPEEAFQNFVDITNRSIFSLCPRGYGRSSFRMYEVMQLGSIPVYIYDIKWAPFEDDIDWNEFCVMISTDKINNINEILSSYSPEKIKQIQDNLIKYWESNFCMKSVSEKIINKLQ